jgi:hypothetical protein
MLFSLPADPLTKLNPMRIFFTVFTFLSFAWTMQAQITLERQDYTLQLDSVVKGWFLDTEGLALPEQGAGVTWDFSGQAVLSVANYTKHSVNDPNFPQANVVQFTSQPTLNGLALVPSAFFELLDDDGYSVIGRSTAEVKVPSGPLTGSPGDTITFIESFNTYQEPLYYTKFPLNYDDNWTTNLTLSTDFEITVGAFGLNKTPASQVVDTERVDSVAGWGTLILPHPDGTGSVTLEVLMLKTSRTQQSTYFLAGMPAPQVMLDVLGLTQGSIATSGDYSFFAKGFPRSVLDMSIDGDGNYRNATFSDDIRTITSSTANPAASRVETQVFPNPSSGDFNLRFEKADSRPWALEVFNTLGQRIHHQAIAEYAGEVHTTVRLKSSSKGLLHYALRNADGVVVASGNMVAQ